MTELEKLKASLHALPVFPLPSVLLLPYEMLPLHVFEPRYRALVRDLLESQRPIGIVQRAEEESDAEGRPALEPVFGAGFIVRHEKLPDGRFHILVKGTARVRLVRELSGSNPWREVSAELVEDEPASGFDSEAASESLRRMLFALCAARSGPGVNALAEVAARSASAGDLADVVIAALVTDEARRRRSMVDLDLGRRVEIAQTAIAELLMGPATARPARFRN